MTLAGEAVRGLELEPKPPEKEHPKRVLVKPEHMTGIIDPMSALTVPVALRDGKIDKTVCQRTFPVFNGRERLDIELKFKTMRELKQGGYQGEAAVCLARYKPIAGHRSDRKEIEYFSSRTAAVIYVPISGSSLAVPFSVTLPTPLGPGTITMTGMKSEGRLRVRAASLARP